MENLDAPKNLKVLREARSNLSYEQTVIFNDYLIGSLSAVADHKTWLWAVNMVKGLMEHNRQMNTVEVEVWYPGDEGPRKLIKKED